MIVLVVNVGSTSLKFRVIRMPEEEEIASGKVDRIGSAGNSTLTSVTRKGKSTISLEKVDYAGALSAMLRSITGSEADSVQLSTVDAIGFKTVHARGISGTALLDEEVLGRMEDFVCVAPAHNPPYLRAIRAMKGLLPQTPLVGVFEAHFHTTIPPAQAAYALPLSLYDRGLRKYGFHGASHHYISERVHTLEPTARRIVSCHLGGSSSLCAILDGKSIDTSMGFSPQTGLPQATRCGDIDPYILIYLMKHDGYSIDDVENLLGEQSGLLGVSEVSAEMTDVLASAATGNKAAELAVEIYCTSLRKYIGAYAALLGGLDVVAFTGGIGENSSRVRQKAVDGLEFMGIKLNEQANLTARGETLISDGNCRVWVLPTNEEIIVARETVKLLKNREGTTLVS